MNQLKHVEQLRAWLVRANQQTIVKLRGYVSMVGDNAEAIELLRGEHGDLLLAHVTEVMLAGIGHETAVKANDPASKTRRAAVSR